MFTKGNTWYGSKGFYPRDISPEIFHTFIETLRNINLSPYIKLLEKSSDAKLALYWSEKYQTKFPEEKSILLKDFMSWMFKENCEFFDRTFASLAYLYSLEKVETFKVFDGLRKFDEMDENLIKIYDKSSKHYNNKDDKFILDYIEKYR